MELLSNTIETVEKRVFKIQDQHKVYYYTEFYDRDGRYIDFTLTDKYGAVEDAIIYETIQQFLADKGL